MNKIQFWNLKNYIRSLCLDSVKELCNNVGLNEYETSLLIHINRNDTRVHTAMTLGVCESKITKDTRKIFLKINDYLKRNNLET